MTVHLDKVELYTAPSRFVG